MAYKGVSRWLCGVAYSKGGKAMQINDDMTMPEIMNGFYEEYGLDFSWSLIETESMKKTFLEELSLELLPDDPFKANEIHVVYKCEARDEALYVSLDSDGNECWRIYYLTFARCCMGFSPEYMEFASGHDAARYIQQEYIRDYLSD